MGKHKRTIIFIFTILISFLFIPKANASIFESDFYFNGQLLQRGSFVYIDSNDFTFKVTPTYSISYNDITTDAYVGQTFTDELYLVVNSGDGKITTTGARSSNIAVSIKDLGYKAPLPNSTWMEGDVYLVTITWVATDSGDNEEYALTWFDTVTATFTLHNDTCCPWYVGYNIINQTVGTSTNLDSITQQQQSEIIKKTGETNALLEDANAKQQEIINSQNATNSKLDQSNSLQSETNSKLDANKQAVDNNTSALNNQTDTMKDSNSDEATSEAGTFFSGFTTDTFGLTSIITAPLNLITSITSSSCTSVGISLPYLTEKKLELPCLRGIYEQHFGSILTIYQTITFGFVAYWVCVRIFALVKDFKNPEHDEIEVLDL